MSHPRGGGLKSGVRHTKKKKKCCQNVFWAIQSHLRHTCFQVKNGGCPYFWAFLADFGQNFMNFANFSKYFEILGGKRKKFFFDRCAQKWILGSEKFWVFLFVLLSDLGLVLVVSEVLCCCLFVHFKSSCVQCYYPAISREKFCSCAVSLFSCIFH